MQSKICRIILVFIFSVSGIGCAMTPLDWTGDFSLFEPKPPVEEAVQQEQASPMRSAKTLEVGMGMDEVRYNWGSPSDVFEAGESQYLIQKWVYRLGSSRRVIYFEKGRVVGWELD